MVNIHPIESLRRRYEERCQSPEACKNVIRAYLEGNKTLRWAQGMIQWQGVNPRVVLQTLNEVVAEYSNNNSSLTRERARELEEWLEERVRRSIPLQG